MTNILQFISYEVSNYHEFNNQNLAKLIYIFFFYRIVLHFAQ